MRHVAAFVAVAALLLVVAVSASSLAGYHPEQLQALDILYQKTNGDGWKNRTEWTNPLYCLRFGVVCDAQRNVLTLSLSDNNLLGTLDITLQQLTSATSISLSVNRLSGTIPSWTGMNNLTSLSLAWNSFSGQLPDLNRLSSQITSISLYRNQLSGGINGVNMITSLQKLDLSYNLFTDSLNNVKFYLPRLTTLDLSSNYFRGNLNWIKQIPTITSLNIARNQFSGPATPLLALNSSMLSSCSISVNAFHCPVDSAVRSKCPYTCSTCATTYDSCDYCLDPACQWCSTDGTGVNGFCIERTGTPFVCGGGFGVRTSTCARNCTSDYGCYSNPAWYTSCSGRIKVSLSPKCDIVSGKCITPTIGADCGSKGCCWNKNDASCSCCA